MASSDITRAVVRSTNQCSSHRPPSAVDVTEYAYFPSTLRPHSGFGPLATVFVDNPCKWPIGHRPRGGLQTFFYARSREEEERIGGDLIRAKDRIFSGGGSDGCDDDGVWANDPINHPEFSVPNYNYEGRGFDKLTEHEKRTLEMAVHYPDIKNGIMKAPFLFRTRHFTLPRAVQPELVWQVFALPELFNNIIAHLMSRQEDLQSLCQTCQLMAQIVESIWMRLDARSHEFGGWDVASLTTVRSKEARQDCARTEIRPFSPAVFVSPVRDDQDPKSGKIVFRNEHGYPLNLSVNEYQRPSFGDTMLAHYKLFHFAYLNGSAVKNLVLHSMEWLTLNAIKSIVAEMPNLKTLGIYQCFLLTIGDTMPLLEAIGDINKKRYNSNTNQPHIALDFSPFYFKGPHYKMDGSGRIGEYGIVPEEVRWLHSTEAVTALLLRVWRECSKGSQDFFTPGTAFRAYLERLPIRTLPSILVSIKAIHDLEPVLFGVDKKLANAMLFTVWQNLVVSTRGSRMTEKSMVKMLISRERVTLQVCAECDTPMPACFYRKDIHSLDRPSCYGCQLTDELLHHDWCKHTARLELAEVIFYRRRKTKVTKYSRLGYWPLKNVLSRIAKPAGKEICAYKEVIGQTEDPILTLPGTGDVVFMLAAERLWVSLTVNLPDMVRAYNVAICEVTACGSNVFTIHEYGEAIDSLQKGKLGMEFQMGLIQRSSKIGSLHNPCRSWELNIKDFRAERVIEHGRFVNNGPVPLLFDVRDNVASMMGNWDGVA